MLFKSYTDLRQELKRHHAFGMISDMATERFSQALLDFKSKFDIGMSEEDEKGFVCAFLKKAFYEGSHAIRVGARHKIDCQIHVSNDGESPIGVIVENKYSKAKGGEMVEDGDMLHKAFYETILYYLREREAKNNSLRRIVITNMDSWFIFDALDYDRIFYRSGLLEKYRDYAAKRVSDARTAAFYAECEEFVKQSNVTLRYAFFKFKDMAYTQKGDVKRNITDLYYLLSPYYLLKEDNEEKTVRMNSAFYNELLYIMGLGEVEENGARYIRRLPAASRMEGSLVENVISFIYSHGLSMKLEKFFADLDEDERVFSTALNLSITWINRLLFLKLLEGQLLLFHNGDRKYKFFKTDRNVADNNITYADIDDLFFYILNVPEEQREPVFGQKYKNVPYLNSSLFEPTEMEKEIMFIGNLNHTFPLPLYRASVLNGDLQEDVSYTSLQYLLHFLDKFDFGSGNSSEGSTDRLISASVLGYIFEKINGYQDGSFYTPENITQYMCDTAIEEAVIARFREHSHYEGCTSITDIYNAIDNEKEANEIFYSVKICDPAVGSGHFLVAALNKMMTLRRDLGLMKDERGKLITRSVNIDIVADGLRIVNADDGQPFRYQGSGEPLYIQKALFNEKKAIIENCLFGVDINPNAANICRLRLWIELLKSAYYNDNDKLQTLPNIDINIKCGDSLVQRYAIRTGKSVMDKVNEDSEVGRLIGQYGEKVSLYKETYDKKTKALLREDIDKIKRLISENAHPDLFVDTTGKSIYHNSLEWMLEFPEVWNGQKEFMGFDVVIGNPPYIFNRNLDKRVRNVYANWAGKTDSYVYFFYLGLSIVRKGGILSFITPNTYFTLTSHASLRKDLLKYGSLKLTYSGCCFSDANVDTMILQMSGREQEHGTVSIYGSLESSSCYDCDKQVFQKNILSRFFVPDQQNLSLYRGIQTELADLYERTKNTLTRNGTIANDARREAIENYCKTLRAGSLTFLGLISDGDQGLVTGNNSKYLGVIKTDDGRAGEIEAKFVRLLSKEGNVGVTLDDFRTDKQHYYDIAEELKTKKKKPALFGKFFLYKIVDRKDVRRYEDLTPEEQRIGTEGDCWVEYNRGNAEGLRWSVPATEVINWRKEYVHELKTNANSRWQGEAYYATTGYGWVDYFTNRLKGFCVDIGPYSKNVIKMHSFCPLVSDKFIIALLNSNFIAAYVKNMITITHTLQINDGRLIPVVIPSEQEHKEIVCLVDRIMAGEDETELMEDINGRIEQLYSPFMYL